MVPRARGALGSRPFWGKRASTAGGEQLLGDQRFASPEPESKILQSQPRPSALRGLRKKSFIVCQNDLLASVFRVTELLCERSQSGVTGWKVCHWMNNQRRIEKSAQVVPCHEQNARCCLGGAGE